MEKSMNHEVESALRDVVTVIKESREYQNCVLMKEQMNKNSSLLSLIEEIKEKQKQYVKSGFQDEKLEQELTDLKKNLEEIPLFVEYNQNLEIVNDMIDTVKEQLNDYFKEKLNILK